MDNPIAFSGPGSFPFAQVDKGGAAVGQYAVVASAGDDAPCSPALAGRRKAVEAAAFVVRVDGGGREGHGHVTGSDGRAGKLDLLHGALWSQRRHLHSADVFI